MSKFKQTKKEFKKLSQILCGFSTFARFVADKTVAIERAHWLPRKPVVRKTKAQGIILAWIIVSVVTITGAPSASYAAEREGLRRHDFSISASNVADALNQFSEQTGAVLLFPYDLVEGRSAKPLHGRYDVTEALEILLDGSGLSGSLVQGEVIQISLGNDKTNTDREDKMASGKLKKSLLASVAAFMFGAEAQAQDIETVDDAQESDQEQKNDVIVVTGTNIRGVAPDSTPLYQFDRDEIAKSGFSTPQQFIQSLPQNFATGASEDSFRRTQGGENNAQGAGVNLRGLGTDSTLVLINGRRVASSGVGSFVDVSMIPLSAIDRIDVLTDGASAIYGSDAVGGVVNFILRDDYEGIETRIRYGTVTEGSLDEFQAGVSGGTSWDSGNVFATYEYQDRSALDFSDRSFSQGIPGPFDLLPNVEQHSVLAAFTQELSRTLEVFGTGMYTSRETQRDYFEFFNQASASTSATSEQLGGSLGIAASLSESWRAELVGVYSQNSTDRSDVFTSGADDFTPIQEAKAFTIDGKVDGAVFEMSGGNAQLALGAQYRSESIRSERPGFLLDSDRAVFAVFGETFLPFVSSANRVPGIERLEVNLAARYEDYSGNVGSSLDPKVGLLWAPIRGLNLRGTWSSSFRAPLFSELDDSVSSANLFDIPDPLSTEPPGCRFAPTSPFGCTPALFRVGNNADLKPEESETFTVGFDFQPYGFPGFEARFTYFDTKFKNRIATVRGNFAALVDPQFSVIVTRNPSQDLVDSAVASAGNFFSLSDLGDINNVGAIIDQRLGNFSATNVRGVDFTLEYSIDSDLGDFGLSLNGNYLFEFENQFVETVDPVSVVDTAFNPVDFRARAGVSWSKGPISAAGYVNYTDDYINLDTTPATPVESWTTVDLQMAYDTGESAEGILKNTRFAVSAVNLFNEDPPFLENDSQALYQLGFDPDNASPLGRFISFAVTKRW